MLATEGQIGLNLLNALKGRSREYPLVPHGNLRRAIAKAKTAPESKTFSSFLGSNVDAQSLLFLHWSHTTLFDEISIPIYFSTPPGVSSGETVAREAKKGAEIGTFTIERILHDSKPQIEDYFRRMIERIESAGVSPEMMSQTELLAAMLQAMGLITTGSPLSAMLKLVQPLEDYFADDVPELALTILGMTKSPLLEYGQSRRAIAIRASGLDESRYEAVVSQLVGEGYLKPSLTLFWCEGHPSVPTSYYLAGHRRVPKVRCDVCNKIMRYETFLLLSPPAMTFVRHKKGAVLHLLAWELEIAGIPWNGEAYADGLPNAGELDLVYDPPGKQGVVLVECKSHVTDTPERTIQSNLKKAATQLAKKADVLAGAGIPLAAVSVASNYPVTSARDKVLKSTFDSKARNCASSLDVILLGPGTLSRIPRVSNNLKKRD